MCRRAECLLPCLDPGMAPHCPHGGAKSEIPDRFSAPMLPLASRSSAPMSPSDAPTPAYHVCAAPRRHRHHAGSAGRRAAGAGRGPAQARHCLAQVRGHTSTAGCGSGFKFTCQKRSCTSPVAMDTVQGTERGGDPQSWWQCTHTADGCHPADAGGGTCSTGSRDEARCSWQRPTSSSVFRWGPLGLIFAACVTCMTHRDIARIVPIIVCLVCKES